MSCIAPVKLKIGKVVPCGYCNFCLQDRRNMWSYRLTKELRSANSAFFLTLTYADENLPYSRFLRPELRKTDFQKFMKRLRKYNTGDSVKYYAVGEYGSQTERPHYHAIMFNLDTRVLSSLEQIWNQGNVHVGQVNAKSINYVTKYVVNSNEDYGERTRPFALISKGLGKKHYELNKQLIDDQPYVRNENGTKIPTPRYYRNFKSVVYEGVKPLLDKDGKKVIKPENPWLKEINYVKSQQRKRVADLQEVERLKKLGHSDPYQYIDERAKFDHDRIKSKANKGNSL